MSKEQIKLSAEKSIPARITIGDIREAKAKFGVDLGDNDQCVRFQTDPLTFVDAFWGLYQRHLKAAGVVTKDQLEDLLGEEEVFSEAQDKVVKAISGFFLLLKTVSTKIAEVQGIRLPGVKEEAQ